MKYPDYVGDIFSRFKAAGEEAYIVGGSLRDALLGIAPNDFDVATSAPPEKTIELFSDKRVIETGLKHGTVTVIFGGSPVEITTFRVDGSYTDSRRPDAVTFTRSIEEDLSRRDFTVNAMAFNEERGIVDIFGGQADLKARVIRAVRDPELRFSEDALRIMRAFRFSAQLGFSIEENTLLGAKRTCEGLSKIARERICAEFIKLLTSPSPKEALELMIKHGILPYVTGDYKPSERVISAMFNMQNDGISRLGLFLCEADQEKIREILHSLKCSNKQITGTLAVARGAQMRVDSPTSATALISNTGDHALLAARASYLLGNSPANAEALVAQNRAPAKISDLDIGGKDIILLGANGKEIGRILELLLKKAMLKPEINEKETLKMIAKGIIDGSGT
jgi:tRNA nucleotidyltransferase (CCA-adding enzyme)